MERWLISVSLHSLSLAENPKLVKKREVVLNGTDDLVISLYANGMSLRDIKSLLEQLYGFEPSEQTIISNMTERNTR